VYKFEKTRKRPMDNAVGAVGIILEKMETEGGST
jgi:hypothetical protein